MSPESSFSAAQSALFLELAEALHRCGMSAHRLEDAMEQVGRVLDIDAEVFATPTMLLVSMNQQTRLIRVTPGDIDLGRLGAVDEIAVWLGRGVLTPDEALMQLRRVMSAPHRYSRRAVIAAFGVLSATASVFFGGGWASMAVGGGLGLIVGWGLGALAQRAHIARISALILAFVVAALAGGASIVLPVDRLALTLAALIVLLPGFSLTVALAELSTGHLSAGAARLSGVAVTFLHLSVGAAAGWALFGAGLPAEPPTPWIFEPVIIVASAASLAILFQARFQDFGVIIVSAALAVYVSRAVSLMADPTVGAFGASLLLTLYSNIQARQRDVPASIAQMPGILLLVPGSVGFRGVGALMQNETLTGVHIAFTTIITAAALVAGMLIANALYPARREL